MKDITNELLENRVGQFSIDRELLYECSPMVMRSLFGLMIVIRAENEFYRDSVHYVAFSPLFNPVPKGAEPHKYHIWITENEDGFFSFSAEERTYDWNEGRVSISYFHPEELPMPGENSK